MITQSRLLQLLAGAALSCTASVAHAHFQLLYVNDTAMHKAQELEMAAVFTHPFDGGPTMAMGKPLSFSHISSHNGEKTDLLRYLRAVDWQSRENQARAFRATLPKAMMRALGDHIFVLEPEPYLETEEDLYIQQFTKLIVNVGGVPDQWADAQDLPVDIKPLSKPYANWTGGMFRAQVLADGKPVPFAQIEVEYLNHGVELDKNAFKPEGEVKSPQPAFNTLSTYSDAEGVVTIGLPRAGWWGIAALDIGSTKTYKGKALSQDAVLWIQARDMQ